ncbi:hypothetical protein ACOMHN_001516 [Nucella lapillus]
MGGTLYQRLVPDDPPTWDYKERHEVVMSVNMEYVSYHFEDEYVAVICPVAKRRIVVSYLGSSRATTCASWIAYTCKETCRTFYILDRIHWNQLLYYQSQAEFPFHWINQVESEMDLMSIHPENEYKFKGMLQVPCEQEALYKALNKTQFTVDGILFFQKKEHLPTRHIP